MFDFLTIKKSIDVIVNKHQALCAEIDAAESEIASTRHAHANRKDVIKTVEQWVNGSSVKFTSAVAEFMSGNRYAGGQVAPYAGGFFGLLGGEPSGSMVPNMDACMCALFGEQIKRAIVAEIEAMPWPEEGLTTAERATKIARLGTRVTELKKEVKEIQARAFEAGIDL